MAFYKKDGEEILVGENFVYSPIVTLRKENKDEFTYPQDGWYWFETIEEAAELFGVTLTQPEGISYY